MRLHIFAGALGALTIPAVAQVGAQADVAGATPVVVTPNAISANQLDRIKRALGVQAVSPITATGSEIWQVPDGKLMQALTTGARSPRLAVDYRGEDYRTLFLPVANADLDTATSNALDKVRQSPQLKDVQLVRLRADGISERILRSGFGTQDGLPGAGSVLVNVRPGVDIVMRRKSLSQAGEQLSWSGTAQPFADDGGPSSTMASGDATLVARGDKIFGSIQSGTETFSVIPLGDGLHAIAKVDQTALPPDHPPTPASSSSPGGSAADADVLPTPRPTGPSEVSVGVAYTQAAADLIKLNWNISPDQVAEAAVLHTNAGYQESGITSRLKLAGTKLITGSEKPTYEAMVASVVSPDDGAFDAIHEWRRSIKADVVVVLVSLPQYCGYAADIFAPAPKAFALVKWSCALEKLSFPHEIGHLLGARHNHEDDPDDQPFAYAHGYRVQGWRTIMSYAGGICAGECPRINRWADPNRQWQGVAMGTATRNHDARLVEEMLPVFSTYFDN